MDPGPVVLPLGPHGERAPPETLGCVTLADLAVDSGLAPDWLQAGGYGRALHVWDLRLRRHTQTIDLGGGQQMALGLARPHTSAP